MRPPATKEMAGAAPAQALVRAPDTEEILAAETGVAMARVAVQVTVQKE